MLEEELDDVELDVLDVELEVEVELEEEPVGGSIAGGVPKSS